MTVAELIEELRQCHPGDKVMLPDGRTVDGAYFAPATMLRDEGVTLYTDDE